MSQFIKIVLSIVFIIKGFSYIAKQNPFGWLLLIVGIGNIGYMVYQYAMHDEEEYEE
jgi:hypothetical protein